MCCAQPSFLRNNNLFNKSQTFCWSLLLKTVQSAAIKLYLTCPFGCFPVFIIKLPITRILRKLNLIKKNSVNDTLDFFFIFIHKKLERMDKFTSDLNELNHHVFQRRFQYRKDQNTNIYISQKRHCV